MDLNEFLNEESNPFIKTLLSNARQRAALMALVAKIMMEEDDTLNIRNVKIMICNFFNQLIDEEQMVGDEVDRDVMKVVVTFVEQEQLLEAFKS